MSKVSFSSSSRIFHFVLYPDSHSYFATHILFDLVVNLKYCSKWAFCLHDRDVNDDGILKKPHYHLVISCKYPVRYCDILSHLELPESSVTLPDIGSKTRTFRSMVRYLIHADSPSKFQYDIKDVSSNFDISSFFDLSSSSSGSSVFMDLLDFMSQPAVTKRSVAVYACSCGILGYYRQYYKILWDIIEHERFCDMKLEILDQAIDN